MIANLFRLFFPAHCPVCGKLLPNGSSFICVECLYDMPMTGFCTRADNPITERFWGYIPIVNASAMFWFTGSGGYRNLIHKIKYHGFWSLAIKLGEWYGYELKNSGLYNDIDIVMAVPLHYKRVLSRGYNQSEYIARGIAKSMGVEHSAKFLKRIRSNSPQVHQKREDRWDNVENIFKIRNCEKLKNCHILLVDDVITTGATILSCAEEIMRNVEGCRISIVALAISKSEFQSMHRAKEYHPLIAPKDDMDMDIDEDGENM